MPVPRLLCAALLISLPTGGVLAQAAPDSGQSCVGVQIGTEQYYDCVNRQLLAATRPHAFTSRDAPLTAGSPAPATGTFNQAATQERLGSSFGRSAQPQRPPPPTYALPLIGQPPTR